MFPRNLSLFRFATMPSTDVAGALDHHRVRDVGPLEMFTTGFSSPYRTPHGRLTVEVGNYIGFVHERRERLLPASVINDALAKKVQAIAEEEGRKVGGRERKRIKEDLLTTMLPHAPVRTFRTFGWLDRNGGWLVLDTSSRRVAEGVLTGLREAFGSFPAVPLAPEEGPRVIMTDWLANSRLPASIALGDECELRDPATATGSIMRCRRQDLDAEEVKEHLRNGKQVFQLGLVYDDRISLVLTEGLGIRKLRPLDVMLDAQEQAEHADAQLESDMALAGMEVSRLLASLEQIFVIARPAEA
jgi:recombination associated protein RdgC